MGNHELYMRRRRHDSLEIQTMKAKAQEDKAMRHAERAHLAREKQARQQAERRRLELEEKLRHYADETEEAKVALVKAQAKASQLEEQLQRIQAEAISSLNKKKEADDRIQNLLHQLDQMKVSSQHSDEEVGELRRLTDEKIAEAAAMEKAADAKTKEAEELRQSLEAAKQDSLKSAQALMRASAMPNLDSSNVDEDMDTDVSNIGPSAARSHATLASARRISQINAVDSPRTVKANRIRDQLAVSFFCHRIKSLQYRVWARI